MNAVEFTVELDGKAGFVVPNDVAAKLPKEGTARVIVLTGEDEEEGAWRRMAYEQFFREDAAEDSIYDARGYAG